MHGPTAAQNQPEAGRTGTGYHLIASVRLQVGVPVMTETTDRITFNPDQCGGRPCIRRMRIRVTDVLDLLANGLSFEEILEELPDLEREDIVASIQFATRRIDHAVVAA